MIVSLWRVGDEQTNKLMTLLYKNWLRGGTVKEALRKAQLTLRKNNPPFVWAGFLVVE
jgi:CHAT domain-containing protein